jgi:hypothetical protein
MVCTASDNLGRPEAKESQRRSMAANILSQRYQAGECEGVWTELRELGPLVREAPYPDR